MEEVESLHMRRNDGSEFGQNYENEINVDGTTYTFNTLTISTYYSIQVRAKNSNGNGDWSNYVTYFTADPLDDVTNLL